MSAPAPSDAAQRADEVEPAARGVAAPVAVGVVIAAVVVALAIVGLVVAFESDKLPTGPAMAPPPAPVAAVNSDPSTRTARYTNVRVTMPAPPYACDDSPAPVTTVLASGIICNAPVHPKYDGGSNDWAASAAFGSVSEDLSGATAADTAKAIFEQWRVGAFGGRDTTLSDYASKEVDLGGQPVTQVVGNVHYSVKGVPSTYDRVVVVVLPTENGGYAAYISSRPDDTPTTTLDALNASINSLRYSR